MHGARAAFMHGDDQSEWPVSHPLQQERLVGLKEYRGRVHLVCLVLLGRARQTVIYRSPEAVTGYGRDRDPFVSRVEFPQHGEEVGGRFGEVAIWREVQSGLARPKAEIGFARFRCDDVKAQARLRGVVAKKLARRGWRGLVILAADHARPVGGNVGRRD